MALRACAVAIMLGLVPIASPAQEPPIATDPEPFLSSGKAEIAWRHLATGLPVRWFFDQTRRAKGVFLGPDPSTDRDWTIVGAADWSGDGQEDVLWRNPACDNACGHACVKKQYCGGEPCQPWPNYCWKCAR